MKIPNAASVALIVGLTGLLSGWLTTWLSDPWVPLAILALGLIAKAAEIYLTPPIAKVFGVTEHGKFYRLLLG